MKETIFTLQIQLGNDAVQTWEDIQRLLLRASRSIDRHYVGLPLLHASKSIRDDNGNTVGHYEVIEREV